MLTMQINYSKKQKETTQQVRNVLTELLACASSANTPAEQIDMLKETLQALEDSFLVVVVGEFNAGKSSFINALLNTDKLEEGVTPTTAQINLIRYGKTESVTPIEQWGQLVQLPADLLESISFVDTPGTNAVITEHEVLTRWFLPRADMVLFLSSADRPFSESENKFLLYSEPETLSPVLGDKNRLKQVFINIIDNALKYTREKGVVNVSAKEVDNFINIEISDNGVGIPKSELPKVKDKFYRGKFSKNGSGIGLALANELVLLHSGRIEIKSEENVGTVVNVYLPKMLKD